MADPTHAARPTCGGLIEAASPQAGDRFVPVARGAADVTAWIKALREPER